MAIYEVDYEAVADLNEFVTFYTPAPGGTEVQYVYYKDDPNVELARDKYDLDERLSTADELETWDRAGYVSQGYVTRWVIENEPDLVTRLEE